MVKLSKPQRTHLARAANPLPESMKTKNFPGWPVNTFDMRALAVLERKGLVSSRIHSYMQGIQKNVVVCYVLTDAGRDALASGN